MWKNFLETYFILYHQSLGCEDPLEEGMVAHSSILVWRIPWTEEPGGLQSMRLQGVRHCWDIFTFAIHLMKRNRVKNIVTEFLRILISSKRQKFGLLILVFAKNMSYLEKGSKQKNSGHCFLFQVWIWSVKFCKHVFRTYLRQSLCWRQEIEIRQEWQLNFTCLLYSRYFTCIFSFNP